jgi:hypothetical protein
MRTLALLFVLSFLVSSLACEKDIKEVKAPAPAAPLASAAH